MISAILRHLLSLGVYTLIFVPLLTVFPIFSLATPFIIWLHPSGYNYLFAEVAFWGGPWGCAFWMIFSSPVARSRRLWKKAGYSVHEWLKTMAATCPHSGGQSGGCSSLFSF